MAESDQDRMGRIRIEVVLALPHRHWRRVLELAAGATVGEALDGSGVDGELGDGGWRGFMTGVFGRPCAPSTVLADGDRVELYRPLTADPKEARRARTRRRQASTEPLTAGVARG